MTSVGSGSLIIIALLQLYPKLQASNIVGTDIVQAVPLVISAAIGHLLFGDFQFDIALSLVIGASPGVISGSLVSAKAPGGIVRRALALITLASALKLLEVPNGWTATILIAVVLTAPPLRMVVRRRNGLPALNAGYAHRPKGWVLIRRGNPQPRDSRLMRGGTRNGGLNLRP